MKIHCYMSTAEFNTGFGPNCDASIDENSAGEEGWMMGLTEDGQAHFACPDCAPVLYSTVPITTIHNRE